MCGIAGWIGGLQDASILKQMTDVVSHRGPDGEGQSLFQMSEGVWAALGHRRLSIIDHSTGGQPMFSHDNRFVIVFNGEIYNYVELRQELQALGAVFKSQSDTEVILEGWRFWGEDCLRRFRGMFAFALIDLRERKVILARDPFGKKPLFIAQRTNAAGEEIVFGSEIASLLMHPSVDRQLDEASLHDYLCWRYVPGPNTFFRGIRKLVPGGFISWQGGKVTEKRYWLPPEESPDRRPEPRDAVGEFLEVFEEAVRIRLRADVPVGAFLSSGLDSASIVGTLAHLQVPQIRTYSIGFLGDTNSELPAASETARHFGTLHTPIEINSDDLASLLPQLSRHRGAPVGEAADLPIFVMSREAEKSVKVVLSGEGSDELFGGYPKHVIEAHLGRLASSGLLSVMGKGLLAGSRVFGSSDSRLTIAARAMAEQDFEDRMVRWFGSLTSAERDQIWRGAPNRRATGRIPFQAAAGASPLRRVLHYDQTSWLPDNLLERMDTMTMAASIEARCPFMDVKLAEFASSLPEHWRIKGRVTKRIVREAMARRLPEAVLKRKKIGFRMPVAAWFRGPLLEPFRERVLSSDSVSGRYLRKDVMERLLNDHVQQRANHEKTLWSFFTLETFLREFFQ